MQAQEPRQKAGRAREIVNQGRIFFRDVGLKPEEEGRLRPQAERDGSVVPVVPAEAGTQKSLCVE